MIKIFLPAELFTKKENCDIYGEIQINDNNAISYFVITTTTIEEYRHLGHIKHAGARGAHLCQDVALSFAYDTETPNIYLDKLSIKPPNAKQANVFLYDATKMLQLHNTTAAGATGDNESVDELSDVQMLCELLQQCERSENAQKAKRQQRVLGIRARTNSLMATVSQLSALLLHWRPVAYALQRTVLYEHYDMWRQYRATGRRKLNILLDHILGVWLMLMLLFAIPHPGDYFIQASHWIIKNLHLLLGALKGSPIGLKLNVHLNNFFLDCFIYHVDLWAIFLDLIEPAVRHLFVPIALLGLMGVSFQLALLADLISVIGMHTHCFYIYAAVLYKVEIKGIQVLWKVVLGKRYNALKKRVESHNYMNRQLFLATLFFTCLLFLFPTILVYYVVFTTLRLCIYSATFLLQQLRRRMLEFPLTLLCKWLMGNFFEKESLQMHHEPHVASPPRPQHTQMGMSVFRIDVQASSVDRVFSCENARVLLEECATHQQQAVNTTPKAIFKRILEGTF